jgi:hypothetical protein
MRNKAGQRRPVLNKSAALVLILWPCLAAAQGVGSMGGLPLANRSAGIAGQFFQGDFVNYSAFVSGVWDSQNQTVAGQGGASGGFTVGGGVSLAKGFSDGSSLGLSYHGDYRKYLGGFDNSGTNQSLNLIYSRRLGRRWSLTFDEGAGILFYNNPYYSVAAQPGGGPLTNPFSSTSRFLTSSVYLSYQQTTRLSYVFGGSFLLNRYDYANAFGTTGGIGTASVVYRLTARTSVGGTYTHTYFHYQGGVGQSEIDGGFFNANYVLGRGWDLFFAAGVNYVRTNGVIRLLSPVVVVTSEGPVLIDAIAYNNKSSVPTFEGGVQRRFGKFSVNASVGHGVSPGNGTYLTSSHTFFGGAVSRPFGRQAVLSASANYTRLRSIAGANQAVVMSQFPQYDQTYLTVGYSRVLTPHISGFLSYNYNRYGSFYRYSGVADNRIILGVSFSSRNVPFTFF